MASSLVLDARIGDRALSFPGAFMLNPLTELPVYGGFWADDPAWSNGGVGTAPESLRIGGTLNTTATQSDASARGTLTTSALLGGRRVIDLDGVNDCYPLTTGVSLAQPFEVWAIGTLDTVPKSGAFLGVNSGASARFAGTVATGEDWYANLGGSNLVGGAPVINTPYSTRYIANGNSSQILVNGTSQASGVAAGTSALDQFIVGAGRTAPSTYQFFYDGKIACLLVLPAASITQAHRTAAGLWAAQFYGVPGFVGAFG